MRRIDDTPLIGKRFGRWTVVAIGEKTPKRSNLSCVCECGRKRDVLRENIINGLSTGCRKCSGMAGSSNPAWKGYKDVPQNFYGTLLKSAAARNISVSISIEDVQKLWDDSNGFCALSNMRIVLSSDKRTRTASVDRIDGSKGYEMSNVQFVHKDVNLMKNRFEEDYFIDVCRRIAGCMSA